MNRFFFCILAFASLFFGFSQNKNSALHYFISDVISNWQDSSMAKKSFGKKSAITEIKKLIPNSFLVGDSNKFSITLDFTEAKFSEKGSLKFQTQIIDFTLSLKIRLLYKTEKGLEELNQFSSESSGQILAKNRQTELQKYWKKSIQTILERIDDYLENNQDKIILPFQPAIIQVKYDLGQLDNTDSLGFNLLRKLRADDFKGKPDQLSKAGGATYCGFGLDYDINIRGFKLYIEIKTICVFNKTRSWLLSIAKTDAYILAHEQLHFDICYWQMTRLMANLSQENFTLENLKTKLKKCFTSQFDTYEKLQEQYDEETNHGLDELEQARWAKLVQEKLSGL